MCFVRMRESCATISLSGGVLDRVRQSFMRAAVYNSGFMSFGRGLGEMYGAVDLLFMLFFGGTAWRWRHNLSSNPPV